VIEFLSQFSALDLLSTAARFGTEIVIVVVFVWYLTRRDMMTRALAEDGHNVVRTLSVAFADLKTVIELQTEVMRSDLKSAIELQTEVLRRHTQRE
jgi:hypothetical protein